MKRAWWVAAWLGCAPAQAQAVLDVAAVPGLPQAARPAYADYVLANLPRALAIAGNGHLGWAAEPTLDGARTKALDTCRAYGGTDCRLYAENLDVVWPGLEQHAATPPPALSSTLNFSIIPDERYFWHGPDNAAGVYVWLHGYAGPDRDLGGLQPQGHVRAFNNAGFDVVRFDREAKADQPMRAADWLRTQLTALRVSGYRRVVVGGQSRGGWTSLQMLDTAGLADAVIAISPAAHGAGSDGNLLGQSDDLRRMVDSVPPSAVRLALVQFEGDVFTSDPEVRLRLLEPLRAKIGALLVIDRPPGFVGHYGGEMPAFAPLYANCLLRFVMDATPVTSCGP